MVSDGGPGSGRGRSWRLPGFVERNRWLPVLAWAAAMLVVSSIPKMEGAAQWFPGCDKVLHFIEYSVLGITLRYWSGRPGRFLVSGGIVFGAVDELHQMWVPGRVASLWDLVADACGVTFGYTISRYFIQRKSK